MLMAATANQTESEVSAEGDILYHYCPFGAFLRFVSNEDTSFDRHVCDER